jgi:glycosyltransferase involved in cell wall biosynthesis
MADRTPHAPTPAEPALSVLVSTRNRAADLAHFLVVLEEGRNAASVTSEVVIVDNDSTDETAAVLDRWAAGGPGRVHLFVAPPGKCRALNRALAVARAPVLAFTDDDVDVAPQWVESIVTFSAAHPEYAAGVGPVQPPLDLTDPALLERLSRYRTIGFFSMSNLVQDAHQLHGSNMMLRRSTFERVGGFNEALGPGAAGGMEDLELGARVRGAGLRIGYMPAAVVRHTVDPARLTPEFHRRSQLAQARSRLVIDGARAWRRALPRALEAAANLVLWTVLTNARRRERARGRLIRNVEILRLTWEQRRAGSCAASS